MHPAARLTRSSLLALPLLVAACVLPACTCGVAQLTCETTDDCSTGFVCSDEWKVCVQLAGRDAGIVRPHRDAGQGADASAIQDAGDQFDGGPAPKDGGTPVELNLVFEGPSAIATGSCRQFLLYTVDSQSRPANVSSRVSVTLVGAGSGAFHSDALCTKRIEAAELGPDTPVRELYLRDEVEEELVLTATAVGLREGALGVRVKLFTSEWTNLSPQDSPPTLLGHKAVYDHGRRKIVVYGGWDGSCVDHRDCLNDTMWEFDGWNWTPLCTGCAPGGRQGHGVVYDPLREKVVLFGGSTKESEFESDVWEWDADHGWQLVDDGGDPTRTDAPSPRTRFHFAWDGARNVAVLYGGNTVDMGSATDTWEYAPGTRSWTRGVSADSGGPGPSCDGTNNLVFDPVASRMLLYGGQDCSSGRRDDLWAWDGSGWSKVCEACTGIVREGPGVVVDLARRKLVVVQGFSNDSTLGAEIEGVWEQDLASLDIAPWPKVGAGPTPARDGMTVTWYPELGAAVFFGGNTCGQGCNFAETWTYGGP
ncbi:MAG: hypothetical protein QM765_19700 [Myxococcales bacterium]